MRVRIGIKALRWKKSTNKPNKFEQIVRNNYTECLFRNAMLKLDQEKDSLFLGTLVKQ